MKENSSNDYSNFYPSILNNNTQSKDKKNEILKLDLEPIFESHHYLCPKCLKFPFIKFCKDRKIIRLTCSCVNNKKILIKDFLNKINNFDFENSWLNFENNNNDKDYEDELICKEHNKNLNIFQNIFYKIIVKIVISIRIIVLNLKILK